MGTDTSSFVRALVPDAAFREAAFARCGLYKAAANLWNGESISVEGIAGGSCALAIAALLQHGDRSMLVITPDADSAEQVADDITLFMTPEDRIHLSLFPPATQHDYESESALAIADESFGNRIGILKQLISRVNERFVIVVSMPALLQSVPPPALLKERTQTLAVNCRVDIESLRRSLVEGGYHATSAIDLPGEFALRGYILDIFAPDWEQPIRIELFNDEIESIRRFDLTTQRSLERIPEIDLTRLQPYECVGASLLDYVSSSLPIVLLEPEKYPSLTGIRQGAFPH